MNPRILEIDNINTISVKAVSFPEGINEAFQKIESSLDSLKGRKFYGALCFNSESQTMEYRACLVPADENEVSKLGFEKYIIPGGKYAAAKLNDWESHTNEIGKTFSEISSNYETDSSRPQIEYYRSQKELILMSPIK
jgi:predicted transcriptional regulator YdeE